MANYNVTATGTRTSGASTTDDWSDANCYAASNVSGAIRAAIEAGDGNVVIINDGTYEYTSAWNSAGWSPSTNKVTVQPRFNEATLLMASVDQRFAVINHASAACKFEFKNIWFGRKEGFDVTASSTNSTLFTIAGAPSEVTFDGGGVTRISLNVSASGTQMGAIADITGSNARTVTFKNFSRRNLNVTQSGGGATMSPGIRINGANTTVIFDGVVTDGVNITSNTSFDGIDHVLDGTLTLRGHNKYKNVTANVTGGTNTLRGCIKASDALTQDRLNSILEFDNITVNAPGAGCFGIYIAASSTMNGLVYGHDCTAVSEANSVGGLVLSIGSGNATLNEVLGVRNKAPFGATVYCSDGGSATVKLAVAVHCQGLGGQLYKGGDGDLAITTGVCIGNSKYTANTHQPANTREILVYGHTHPSTATRNSTYTIGTLVTKDNEDCITDLANQALIVARNENATYTFAMTISNLINLEKVAESNLLDVIDTSSAGVTQTITARENWK